jgi:hypothetical protein
MPLSETILISYLHGSHAVDKNKTVNEHSTEMGSSEVMGPQASYSASKPHKQGTRFSRYHSAIDRDSS